MQGGDRIALLHGASVPYVLRPTKSGRYLIIGEAYVLGIMHGEFMATDPAVETVDIE